MKAKVLQHYEQCLIGYESPLAERQVIRVMQIKQLLKSSPETTRREGPSEGSASHTTWLRQPAILERRENNDWLKADASKYAGEFREEIKMQPFTFSYWDDIRRP